MNPFRLAGPDFLVFYIQYSVLVFAVALIVRWWLMGVAQPGPAARTWVPGRYPGEGDAYRIALLSGGANALVRTVLARLAASNLLTLDEERASLREDVRLNEASFNPIELAVIHGIRGEARMKELFGAAQTSVRGSVADMEHELRKESLLRTPGQLAPFRLLFFVALAAGPGLGLARIASGIVRARPVLYLVLLTGIVMVGYLHLLKPPRRTLAGDRYLDWLRSAHRGLRGLVASRRRVAPGEVALCVAIYGLASMESLTPIDRLRRALRPDPVRSASGGCGSGCGASPSSGCGSSGCGGGGGCGGCGGCGG